MPASLDAAFKRERHTRAECPILRKALSLAMSQADGELRLGQSGRRKVGCWVRKFSTNHDPFSAVCTTKRSAPPICGLIYDRDKGSVPRLGLPRTRAWQPLTQAGPYCRYGGYC